jgi:hypothetical protein
LQNGFLGDRLSDNQMPVNGRVAVHTPDDFIRLIESRVPDAAGRITAGGPATP